jgi:hypothetical protein
MPLVTRFLGGWARGRKALQDMAMQRQTSTNQRDALGQDTGRSQGHLRATSQEERPGEALSNM